MQPSQTVSGEFLSVFPEWLPTKWEVRKSSGTPCLGTDTGQSYWIQVLLYNSSLFSFQFIHFIQHTRDSKCWVRTQGYAQPRFPPQARSCRPFIVAWKETVQALPYPWREACPPLLTLEEVVLCILVRIVCLSNNVKGRPAGQHLKHQHPKCPPVHAVVWKAIGRHFKMWSDITAQTTMALQAAICSEKPWHLTSRTQFLTTGAVFFVT